MVNIRKFLQGIGLVPVSSTAIDSKGEMEVLSSDGRLYWHDGSAVQKVTGNATTDTLTNKTLTSPVIGTIVNSGTLTLPTSTDTLVGRATTDTLTNKTISGSSNTLSNIPASAVSSGQVAVANGGTGAATLTNHGVVIGQGTSAVAVTAAGTAGQPLLSGGPSADPAYGTLGTGAGGTGVTSVTIAPAASAFAGWDSNKNLSANNLIEGYATTVTAAGTTTLTVASAGIQYFTGTTTQTVVMPVVSGLVLGQQWIIVNRSTGVVTVQSSGANTIKAMEANSKLVLTVISTSGTGVASWDASYGVDNAILPVADGGTGQSSFTDGQLLIGNSSTGLLSKATLSAGSNITITNGNGSISIASAGGGFTAASYCGTQVGAGGGWTNNTNTSYVDFSAATTSNTLTQIDSNNITAIAKADKTPAIDATLPATGRYLISVTGSGSSNGSNAAFFRLVDGSGTIINGGQEANVATSQFGAFSLTGVYNCTSIASAITFKLQGAATAGNANIAQDTQRPLTWTVVRIS